MLIVYVISEMISTLVGWGHPHAFPAGILGHLAPLSEESHTVVEESTAQAPEFVNKECSPHLLDHKKVIPQAEKDALVESTQTLVDQATLSITEPDSEPQLTTQAFIANHCFSLPNNGTRVAEHDHGVMVEETAQGGKINVEISSKNVTQLVDEDSANELASIQQDSVDTEIGSMGIDTFLQETEIRIGKTFRILGLFFIFILPRCRWFSSISSLGCRVQCRR